MSQNIVEIDGGVMEGGGQILRMSVALSALLGQPIRVFNIRAGRKNPGLRPQHLGGIQLVKNLCDGHLTGGTMGSTEIVFHPQKIKSGKFYADTGTAGSVMLLFQVAFPCLLFASGPTELHFKGGTNAEMAPQIDHTLMVFKPIIEKFGVKFDCCIIKRGYFPKGGGEVVITATPLTNCIKPIELLDPGSVTEIYGRSFVAGVLPYKMSHIMADAASNLLQQYSPEVAIEIERTKEPPHVALGNGSGIILVAKTSTGCYLGGSALGKRDVRANIVGENAANELIENMKNNSCVDNFVQDQLVIFMLLAKGKSQIRCGEITLHTETAIHIAEKLTKAKFNIQRHETESYNIIECEGIGLEK